MGKVCTSTNPCRPDIFMEGYLGKGPFLGGGNPLTIFGDDLETWQQVHTDAGGWSDGQSVASLTNKIDSDPFLIEVADVNRQPVARLRSNGRLAAEFDGTDDTLKTTDKTKYNWTHNGSNGHFVIIEFKRVTGAAQLIFDSENFSSSNIGSHMATFGTGQIANTIGNAGTVTNPTAGVSAIAVGNVYVIVSTYDASVTIGQQGGELFRNNTSIAVSNRQKAETTTTSTSNPSYGLRGDFNGSPLDAYVYEMFGASRFPTTADLDAVVGYTDLIYN